MSTPYHEARDRIARGTRVLAANLRLDPTAESLRVVMSPEMHEAICREISYHGGMKPDPEVGQDLRIAGVLCEPDPCLSLAQMRFRTDVVI